MNDHMINGPTGENYPPAEPRRDPLDRVQDAGTAAREKVDELATQAGETAREAKQRLEESGHAMRNYIEDRRGNAADAMDRTAAGIRDKADRGVSAVQNASNRSAEKLEQTATYLRNHDTEAMLQDTKQVVRNHPAQSLGIAVAIGFLLGRAFRSNREV